MVQPVLCDQSCAIKKKKPSLTTISGAAAELPHVRVVLFFFLNQCAVAMQLFLYFNHITPCSADALGSKSVVS